MYTGGAAIAVGKMRGAGQSRPHHQYLRSCSHVGGDGTRAACVACACTTSGALHANDHRGHAEVVGALYLCVFGLLLAPGRYSFSHELRPTLVSASRKDAKATAVLRAHRPSRGPNAHACRGRRGNEGGDKREEGVASCGLGRPCRCVRTRGLEARLRARVPLS